MWDRFGSYVVMLLAEMEWRTQVSGHALETDDGVQEPVFSLSIHGCLNENGPHRSIRSDTTRRCGLVRESVSLRAGFQVLDA